MKSLGERLADYAVAGNGLPHRRALIGRGLALVGPDTERRNDCP
jgi:hypothetical protein